jgi:hypothetical protein
VKHIGILAHSADGASLAFLDAALEPFPLPGLHIAEIVARRAHAEGRTRVALLGTRWTMEGPAYPDSTRLLARAAVAVALGEAPMPTWRGGPPAARPN